MRQLIKKLARRATIILSSLFIHTATAESYTVSLLDALPICGVERMRDLHYSRTLQLRTNATVESLASYLRRMPQVASVKQFDGEDGLMQFSLQLHQNADMDTAANNIAKCVIEAGARLYQLQPVARDLEQRVSGG